jgi:hypothetical protein
MTHAKKIRPVNWLVGWNIPGSDVGYLATMNFGKILD